METSKKDQIQQFYKEYGIKQYVSFSGGFRFLQKPQKPSNPPYIKPALTHSHLCDEFGVTKTNINLYKQEKDYVPETKQELADKLMDKIQHNIKKMRYYREKYNIGNGK